MSDQTKQQKMRAAQNLKKDGSKRTNPVWSVRQDLSGVDDDAPVWIALEDGTTLSIISVYEDEGIVWIDAEEGEAP